MQPGTLPGLTSDGFKDFIPTIGAFTSPGAPAVTSQVTLGTSTARARYRVRDGFCTYYGQFVFDSTFVNSSTDWIWGVSLPVPGARWSNAADIPIGNGWYSRGTGAAPYYNLPLVPTLMDAFPPNAQQGQEDNWMHFFISYSLSNGTWSIVDTNTDTGNIAHGIGFPPDSRDIQFNVTSITAGSTDIGALMVPTASIDATNFKISCQTAPSTGKTVSGSWKIQAEPGGDTNSYFELLLSGTKPWVAANGCVLGWSVRYEVR